jgi:putative transposase
VKFDDIGTLGTECAVVLSEKELPCRLLVLEHAKAGFPNTKSISYLELQTYGAHDGARVGNSPRVCAIVLCELRRIGALSGTNRLSDVGRQIEVLMSQGKAAPVACREAGISQQSYYRWRKEYGGLEIDQAKRMKDLERENVRLKRLVADLSLEKQVLKDVASGNL